jgi:hypothetical protein
MFGVIFDNFATYTNPLKKVGWYQIPLFMAEKQRDSQQIALWGGLSDRSR